MNSNTKNKITILAVMICLIAIVTPTVAGEWYFKPAYPNYAPSGMPDFNQTQDSWVNTTTGQWSFCGPVAVANCFWWFDSKYADPAGTPGDGADIFPLVQSYGTADDHDPVNVNELVERLALCMNTDGGPYPGTEVHVMEQCIDDWLDATGLNHTFYEHTVKMPEFYYIEEEIKRCQDVILLLGFWEDQGTSGWVRIGGHYVTCAGVDSENRTIAFSDPFIDNAEAGGLGRVPVPHAYPHGPTVHNDAQFVSHDYYVVAPDSPSPGGIEWIPDYPAGTPDFIPNFQFMNVPPEFESMQGEWQSGEIHTEIEYAVLISPLPLTPFLIDGWVDCTNGDPVNDPSVMVTNLNTGEVFIAETDLGSNYFQVLTSSYNVSTGNVLHFNASNGDGNSTEFDHTVTETEMCAGGFTQNAEIDCGGPAGTCGDVNDDGTINMADVMTLWYDYANYPTPGVHVVSNEWAADVNCDETINMADVMTLWYDYANYPTPGAHEVSCCDE